MSAPAAKEHPRQHPLGELQSPTDQGAQHQGARSDHAEQNRLGRVPGAV